jgi:hypothetical protein
LTTLVPDGETVITGITDMYVAEKFGRKNGNGDGSDAEDQWSLLRPMLWRSWFQKKLSRLQRPQRQRWSAFQRSNKSASQDGKEPRSDR